MDDREAYQAIRRQCEEIGRILSGTGYVALVRPPLIEVIRVCREGARLHAKAAVAADDSPGSDIPGLSADDRAFVAKALSYLASQSGVTTAFGSDVSRLAALFASPSNLGPAPGGEGG